MNDIDNILKCINYYFSKYEINQIDRKNILKIMKPIIINDEFKKRNTLEYLHHGKITIVEHVIEDAIKTYLLAKVYVLKKQDNNFDIDISVMIAMLHDLYTIPWQNNILGKVDKFSNKHGFRHPVEAVINSYSWYPELFQDRVNAKMIVDGIIHHMYPLPVTVIDNSLGNKWELKNYELFLKLPNYIKDMIYESTNRGKIGALSIAKSKYMEGRIMSRADKYVSIRQLKNIYDMVALVTGKNKSLKK